MEKPRTNTGILIGGLMGLVFSLVTQTGNIFLLPGVPLYQMPPGLLLTIIAGVVVGMIIGALAVWSEDAIYGYIYSALALTVLSSLPVAAKTGWNPISLLMLFVYTLLPRAVLALPVVALLRWAAISWDEAQGFWTLALRKKAITIALVLGVAFAGGLFSLYPKEEQFSIKAVNTFISKNIGAGSAAELPASLEKIPGFLENARGAYTLATGGDPDTLAVKRPIVSYETVETLVIIRFENGYRMGCVHANTYKEPICWIY